MQPDTSQWRLRTSYDYLDQLPPEGLAWEFLRRNEDYQREFAARKLNRKSMVSADDIERWGLQFLSDPHDRAIDGPVLWSPAANPNVLVVVGTPDSMKSDYELQMPVALTRKSAGTLYVVSPLGDLTFNVTFQSKSKPGTRCAALFPIDNNCLSRIEALTRFWHALSGHRVPPDTRLTLQQRRRFRFMIQAVDGRTKNATYREIANVIYGASRVATDAWKTSPLRDSTIALVRDGKAMIEGKYRQLLKHRRRERSGEHLKL